MAAGAAQHGLHLMFAERHPYAGGAQRYAGCVENDDGFELELVAIKSPERNEDQPIHRP
ncbi:hypothetical protein OHS71_01800 [Streptomyces sp. NBC_00377]|uniref:hypothetical protein n=1 Tax=unclassified Streptomyces TaxID=2593676 RepID=UPI002E24FE3D|nr:MULTISPECIES: hypothetical protein [unclassified Streptomyces]